jgi:hypothetical protein
MRRVRGAQRPVLRFKEPKRRSARTCTSGKNPPVLYSSVPVILCYSLLEEARAYFALFKIIILNLLVRKNNNLYLSLQFFLCSPNGPRPRGRDFNYSASRKESGCSQALFAPFPPATTRLAFGTTPTGLGIFQLLTARWLCVYVYI